MKTIKTVIFSAVIIAAVTRLSAQKSPINVESSGNGAAFTWTTFENDANPTL
jgi:hypothetical protein